MEGRGLFIFKKIKNESTRVRDALVGRRVDVIWPGKNGRRKSNRVVHFWHGRMI
jgi:hypothetical protein